jgi:hypothetical protein
MHDISDEPLRNRVMSEMDEGQERFGVGRGKALFIDFDLGKNRIFYPETKCEVQRFIENLIARTNR